jgi:hypothetical protein
MPHASGIETTAHATATSAGDDFFAISAMFLLQFRYGTGDSF